MTTPDRYVEVVTRVVGQTLPPALRKENVSQPASAAPATVEPAASVPKDMSGTARGHVGVPFPFAPPAGNPMLSRFWFGYTRGDHHFGSIETHASANNLSVGFADVNRDDEYSYQVSYRWVTPTTGIVAGQASTPSSCCVDGCFLNLSAGRPSSDHVLVLRGFFLDWRDVVDRHVDTVEVLQDGASVWTALSDDGDDTPYRATLVGFVPLWMSDWLVRLTWGFTVDRARICTLTRLVVFPLAPKPSMFAIATVHCRISASGVVTKGCVSKWTACCPLWSC